ncbi:hypothetical protein JX265_008736 [Neoarthrinium moseri]|uniref:Bacteriocin-protection protein n=1 Tax=Neoarthrinium moseri TaxID=1658444 RepID=A0A9P9WHC4_9PEZI|nr:uncharacterized protein JN550_008788 [Neoarthrinium moseri]KAI1848482.1 hypothetical protein JX266_005788 [Neoarthrinium moseri]KAI1863519.1 hypothetical protein JX265_008736 [Neoarthrinium moseri]KAI1864501.1 hypothetical protein JN550_008788 [Neoarthrinium moseri]
MATKAGSRGRQSRRAARGPTPSHQSNSWEDPIYFQSPAAFGAWLSANHDSKSEVFVGYFKKHTGLQVVTWSDAVDEALCWGWIDGQRRRVDDSRLVQRFTPRARKSHWSRVNVDKVALLEAAGRMQEPGRAAFARRTEENTAQMSFERELALSNEFAERLTSNKTAAAYLKSRTPGYKRQVFHWVMSAKRLETQERRLEELISSSENQELVQKFKRQRS